MGGELHPRGGGGHGGGIDEGLVVGAAFDEAEHGEFIQAAADAAGMGVEGVEGAGGEEVGHASGDEEAELDVLGGFVGAEGLEAGAEVDAVAEGFVAGVFEALGEAAFAKEEAGGEFALGDFDVAEGADDVQAVGVEEVAFIHDDDEALAALVHVGDVVGERFDEVLDAGDAGGEGEIQLGKNLAE